MMKKYKLGVLLLVLTLTICMGSSFSVFAEEVNNNTTSTQVTDTNENTDVSAQDPTEIVVLQKSVSLYRKGTAKLKYSVNNAVGATSFESSNSKIVKVNSAGTITAVQKGTATITVKNNDATDSIRVTVKNPYLKANSKTLYVGESYQLKLIGNVGTAKYSSSKNSVASVSSSGKIKAKKSGTATIKVKTNGITLKFKLKAVTVNKNASAKTIYTYFKRKGYPLTLTKYRTNTKKGDLYYNRSLAECNYDYDDYATVTIHIYRTSTDAVRKSAYVHAYDGTIFQTHVYRIGKVVITADMEVTSSDWKQIKSGLDRISKGKLPLSYK
jgi:uncharacterized protein YjdB